VVSLYDAHNHLQDAALAPHRARVFADLASVGVRRAVVNGTCETDWSEVAALAKERAVVLPSYGLHPWDAGNRTSDWQKNLRARLTADPHSAVGEIGLDRWIIDGMKPGDPRLAGLRVAPLEEQREVFAWQLALAAELDRAVSIHCLQAFGPLLEMLAVARLPARGFLLHAYSGSAEMARSFADLGAYFSFNGNFLGKLPGAKSQARKKDFLHTYTLLPADRLLVETDAPAMRLPATHEKFPPLPAPDGSLANHPANLAATYAALAELRGVMLESLVTEVEKNFLRLFAP
jgi:TatD DNase family protein